MLTDPICHLPINADDLLSDLVNLRQLQEILERHTTHPTATRLVAERIGEIDSLLRQVRKKEKRNNGRDRNSRQVRRHQDYLGF